MDPAKQKGIGALNQDFARYDQVNKEQIYHLAEKEGEDQFDDEYEIKTCDLSHFFHGGPAGQEKFARELGEALKGIGFAILEGHGVDPKLYEKGAAMTRELFENTSLAERMKYKAQRHGSVNQGYFPDQRDDRDSP